MAEVIHVQTPEHAEKPFSAGVVVTDGKVTEAAPILRYMLGWSRLKVLDYCQLRRWQVEITQSQ